MSPGIPLGAALACLIWAGCAPRRAGVLAGGAGETRLAPDEFRIELGDDGYTHSARVQDLALLRAAELCLASGLPYFAILDESSVVPRGRVPALPKRRDGLTVMGYAKKPAGFFTFDAAFLRDELREKYGIGPGVSPPASGPELASLRKWFAKMKNGQRLRVGLGEDTPGEFLFAGYYPGEDSVALRPVAGGPLSGRFHSLRNIRTVEPVEP
jgi:hypothetical protein